jgi:hypothetical protein
LHRQTHLDVPVLPAEIAPRVLPALIPWGFSKMASREIAQKNRRRANRLLATIRKDPKIGRCDTCAHRGGAENFPKRRYLRAPFTRAKIIASSQSVAFEAAQQKRNTDAAFAS